MSTNEIKNNDRVMDVTYGEPAWNENERVVDVTDYVTDEVEPSAWEKAKNTTKSGWFWGAVGIVACVGIAFMAVGSTNQIMHAIGSTKDFATMNLSPMTYTGVGIVAVVSIVAFTGLGITIARKIEERHEEARKRQEEANLGERLKNQQKEARAHLAQATQDHLAESLDAIPEKFRKYAETLDMNKAIAIMTEHNWFWDNKYAVLSLNKHGYNYKADVSQTVVKAKKIQILEVEA